MVSLVPAESGEWLAAPTLAEFELRVEQQIGVEVGEFPQNQVVERAERVGAEIPGRVRVGDQPADGRPGRGPVRGGLEHAPLKPRAVREHPLLLVEPLLRVALAPIRLVRRRGFPQRGGGERRLGLVDDAAQ